MENAGKREKRKKKKKKKEERNEKHNWLSIQSTNSKKRFLQDKSKKIL